MRSHSKIAAVPSRRNASLAGFAETLLKERQERDEALGTELFGEPGWNMQLALFAAAARGKAASEMEVCAAAGIPIATALRWIRVLDDAGTIQSRQTPLGRRLVELRPGAYERLERLLWVWLERRRTNAGQRWVGPLP